VKRQDKRIFFMESILILKVFIPHLFIILYHDRRENNIISFCLKFSIFFKNDVLPTSVHIDRMHLQKGGSIYASVR
jgi:hypothetical protein